MEARVGHGEQVLHERTLQSMEAGSAHGQSQPPRPRWPRIEECNLPRQPLEDVCLLRLRDVEREHAEFVAAEACHKVRLSEDAA
jgi:hypothetical protein